jgi:hypothetical protein
MSAAPKRTRGKGRKHREISIRSVRREEIDTRRLAHVLLQLAADEAAAERQHERLRRRRRRTLVRSVMSDDRLIHLLLVAVTVSIGATTMSRLSVKSFLDPETWFQLHFGRDVSVKDVTEFLRAIAADRRQYAITFEVVGIQGHVHYRLGVPSVYAAEITRKLQSFVPSVVVEPVVRHEVGSPTRAWQLSLTTSVRPLRVDHGESVSRAVLSALTSTGKDEVLFLQWVLGPRIAASQLHANSRPAESWTELLKATVLGEAPLDHDERRDISVKLSEPGFRVVGRIGVRAAHSARETSLALRLVGALRIGESVSTSLRIDGDRIANLASATHPRRWPMRLNILEVTTMLGWPLGRDPLPGLNRTGSTPLRPHDVVVGDDRVIGESAFPGDERRVALPLRDALQHLHVLGPTGVGKSTLLLGLIEQDIAAGRGVVVIDPKGDLINDVLGRIPEARQSDVVVLDPTDESRPVGLNVLASTGRSPELVADQILAVFHGLYKDSWGPRTQDILHASLLTLVGKPGVTLCNLPLLLSDARYRASMTSRLSDEIALGPFWHWYEHISEAERLTATAPIMNKLRAFLLRPRMRAVLGQAQPRFHLGNVFTKNKIVLVSLAKGTLGPEAAALLGSLVVSQLWQSALGRVADPAAKRSPVMVFIDEFQDYLHLPTDLADVLAQARGLGLGLTLAHQHLGQLTPTVRSAVMANARSRVSFQLSHDDAKVLAAMHPGLEASDFAALPRYAAYASLVAEGNVMPPASVRTRAPSNPFSDPARIRNMSRTEYGTPLEEVEAGLRNIHIHKASDEATRSFGKRRQS